MEELGAEELRVIGSLIEQELTTPQHYTLTLNALVLACNQTSNRYATLRDGEVYVTEIAALAPSPRAYRTEELPDLREEVEALRRDLDALRRELGFED